MSHIATLNFLNPLLKSNFLRNHFLEVPVVGVFAYQLMDVGLLADSVLKWHFDDILEIF